MRIQNTDGRIHIRVTVGTQFTGYSIQMGNITGRIQDTGGKLNNDNREDTEHRRGGIQGRQRRQTMYSTVGPYSRIQSGCGPHEQLNDSSHTKCFRRFSGL